MTDSHRGIDGPTAWDAIASHRARNWDRTVDRFSEFPITVEHEPKFSLQPGANVFCIGSCFARNIEEHLIYNGMTVSSRRMISPMAECGAGTNAVVNKFTTPSMMNEIRWAADTPDFSDCFFANAGDGLVSDLQLAPGSKPVTLERAIERRRYLATDYFTRIFDADVIVITLGLDECWHDREAGIDLNGTPSLRAVKDQPDRFFVRAMGFVDTLHALEKMEGQILARNPAARFVITVSPVPLAVTFISPDPAVASTRAKAMLRSVAEAFCTPRGHADYFPSYEMITLSPRVQAFDSDCRHVSEAAVARVVGRFLKLYMGLETAGCSDFREVPYLVANPDVEDAVRRGEFDSGFAHWLAYGRNEGRSLWPDQPDKRMRKRGMTRPNADG